MSLTPEQVEALHSENLALDAALKTAAALNAALEMVARANLTAEVTVLDRGFRIDGNASHYIRGIQVGVRVVQRIPLGYSKPGGEAFADTRRTKT